MPPGVDTSTAAVEVCASQLQKHGWQDAANKLRALVAERDIFQSAAMQIENAEFNCAPHQWAMAMRNAAFDARLEATKCATLVTNSSHKEPT